MDGFELARRAKTVHPDLKVVYSTGNPDLASEKIGDTFGPLLKKPYPYSRLTTLLGYMEQNGNYDAQGLT